MDAIRLSDVLHDLYACSSQKEIGDFAVHRLAALLGNEQVVWNHFHTAHGVLSAILKEEIANVEAAAEGASRNIHDNPWWPFGIGNPARSFTYRLSDRISDRAYRSTGLYAESYKAISADYQCAVGLWPVPTSHINLMICRTGRDFSDEEAGVLKIVRPHLMQAWKRASELEDLQRRLRAFSNPAELTVQGCLVAYPNGFIQHADAVAYRLLQRFFPARNAQFRLPALLLQRLGGAAGKRTVRFSGEGADLVATVAQRRSTNAVLLITLREFQATPDHSARPAPRLTPREMEIWRYLAMGKTNAELGIILEISPRTAEKHVENLCAKLGVENRRAAIAHWFQIREEARPKGN